MSDERLAGLIESCVERLSEKDSPSLETLKMQIAFDTTHSSLKTDLEDIRDAQESGISDLQRSIVNANVLTGDEFENLSNVYRDVFSCLMFTYQNLFDPTDRITADREVAAAMEYQNRFFMCENADAQQGFMRDPSGCLNKIRQLALKQPELIDILDLLKLFPDLERVRGTSRRTSSRKKKARKEHPLLAPAAPTKCDVGT